MSKIAFCLTGLTGSISNRGNGDMLDINYGYSHYKKHIFNVNENVDTFIHSWSI